MNIHTFLVKNVNYTFEDSFILVLGNEVFGEKESVEYDTSSEHKLISSFPFQLSSICHQQSTVSISILYFYSYVVSFALTLWRVKTVRDKTKAELEKVRYLISVIFLQDYTDKSDFCFTCLTFTFQ